MRPAILGLYASLACRVYSRMVGLSEATSLAYAPPAMGSAVSRITWSPGLEEMYRRLPEGQTLHMRYDPHKNHLTLEENPVSIQGRKMLQETTTTVAPSQQTMHREYSEVELKSIAKAVYHMIRGQNYDYDSAKDKFTKHDTSTWDVTGCCGQVKVFDAQTNQLVFKTCCCYLGDSNYRNRASLNCAECCVWTAGLCLTGAATCWCRLKFG